MSTLLEKENAKHSSEFIENVVSCNNNASSAPSSPDDFDDDSAGNSTTPALKANSIAASATSSILTNLSRLNAHHLSASNSNYRKDMGGFSIPHHHGLSAAFYGYHSHTSQIPNECLPTVTSSSILPAQHGHHHHHHHYSPSTTTSNGQHRTVSQHSNVSASTNSNSNINAINNSSINSNKSPPFLLPAQLYKSLFANAVLHNSDKMCSHPFPRNLLFSYSDKSPNSPDFENDEKPSISTEVSLMYLWLKLILETKRNHNGLILVFFFLLVEMNWTKFH